jgi:integrase
MILPLKRQMVVALTVWESDGRNKVPLMVPHQLVKKYPETRFYKHWAWLFPQHHPCKAPRTGERVRFHMHPANVQRAFKAARAVSGVNAIPHEMRHAHATHLLDAGVNPKALQEEMGHVDIRTTMGYCHAEATSVPDPNQIIRNSVMQVPHLPVPGIQFQSKHLSA